MRRRSIHGLARSERGQSAVELALAFPVLLLILMGIFDFGRAFFAYVNITNASREGASYGAQNLTTMQIVNGQPTRVLNSSSITCAALNELLSAPYSCPASWPGGTPEPTVSIACAAAGSSSYTQSYCTSAVNGDQILVTVSDTFDLYTTGILPFGNSILLSNYSIMAITSGLQP